MTITSPKETHPLTGAGPPASREVSYWSVYQFLSPLLGDPGLIPGTPEWCQLDDTNPTKWQAILWSAVWWTVEQDTRQHARVEASHEISSAANWSAIAQHERAGRGAAYIPRKKSA